MKKLNSAMFIAHKINPAVAVTFCLVYWFVGLNAYLYPTN